MEISFVKFQKKDYYWE